MRVCFIIAFFSQIFTYSVWTAELCNTFDGEEGQCVAGTVSLVGAFNVVLLLMLSLMSCLVDPPRHPVFKRWNAPPPIEYETDKTETDDETHMPREIRTMTRHDTSVCSTRGAVTEDDSSAGTSRFSRVNGDGSVVDSRRSRRSSESIQGSVRSGSIQGSVRSGSKRASVNGGSNQDSVRSGGSKQGSVRSGGSKQSSVNSGSKQVTTVLRESKKVASARREHESKRGIFRFFKGSMEAVEEIISDVDSSSDLLSTDETIKIKNDKRPISRQQLVDGNHIVIVEKYAPPAGSVLNHLAIARTYDEDDTEHVKFSTSFLPDGRKTIKEVTHSDGSCTVTTTFIPISSDDDIELSVASNRS
jgi:hypothetical protein